MCTGDQDFLSTPNAGFSGTDSFAFTASDGTNTSGAATVTINVNEQPVATGASFSTSEIISYDGSVSATDAEGDAVIFAVSTSPSKGVLSAFDTATGSFTYTPDVAQDGLDSFAVTASDAFQSSAEAIVNVEIFKWAGTQQFGTAFIDFAATLGMHSTADGGLIFGGATAGQISSTPLIGQRDAWLRKVDRRGNEVWTRQFGDTESNNGRIVVPDPDGSGTFVIVSQAATGAATLYKFDNDGNEQLRASVDFQGVNLLSAVYWGNVDSNGDLYILSWINGNTSLITKVDGANGNTLWQRVLEGAGDLNPTTPFNPEWGFVRVRSVDFDSAGNALIAGWYIPEVQITRNCTICGFLLTYDPDGNLLSSVELDVFSDECKSPADTSSDPGLLYRVTVAPDQTLWAVGASGVASIPSLGSFAQVSHFSSDGSQLLWSYCDTMINAATFLFTPARIAANGDALVVSYILPEFDASTGEFASSELVATRLDVNGNVVFRKVIGGTKIDGTPARMIAGSVVEDQQGVLFLSGATNAELVSGAATGDDDVFLLRLDADGNLQ